MGKVIDAVVIETEGEVRINPRDDNHWISTDKNIGAGTVLSYWEISKKLEEGSYKSGDRGRVKVTYEIERLE